GPFPYHGNALPTELRGHDYARSVVPRVSYRGGDVLKKITHRPRRTPNRLVRAYFRALAPDRARRGMSGAVRACGWCDVRARRGRDAPRPARGRDAPRAEPGRGDASRHAGSHSD